MDLVFKIILLITVLTFLGCGSENKVNIQIDGLSGEMELFNLDTHEGVTLVDSSSTILTSVYNPPISLEITKTPLLQSCEFTTNQSKKILDVGKGRKLYIRCEDKVVFGAVDHHVGKQLYATDGRPEGTAPVDVEDSSLLGGETIDYFRYSILTGLKQSFLGTQNFAKKEPLQKIENYYVYKSGEKHWKAIHETSGETINLDGLLNTIQILNTGDGLISLRAVSNSTTEVWKHRSLLAQPNLVAVLQEGDFNAINLIGNNLTVLSQSGSIVEIVKGEIRQVPLPGEIVYSNRDLTATLRELPNADLV